MPVQYIMGSRFFFADIPGFRSHDVDIIQLVDDETFSKCIIRGHGQDVFLLKRKPKEELIADALKSPLPMVVGKFLIPDFCKEIGFTVEDLNKLHPLIEKLDDKHLYEEVIYRSYLANGEMSLTDEQRAEAYKVYLSGRMRGKGADKR